MKTFLIALILGAATLAVLPTTAHAQSNRNFATVRPNNSRPANINAMLYNRSVNNYNRIFPQNYGPYDFRNYYNNYNRSIVPSISYFNNPAPPAVYYGYSGAVPYALYYGAQPLNTLPHWHTNVTPFGSYNWYGVGPTDLQPQVNVNTPYGSSSYFYGNGGYVQSYPSLPSLPAYPY